MEMERNEEQDEEIKCTMPNLQGVSKNQSCSEWSEIHFVLECLKSDEIFGTRKKICKWPSTTNRPSTLTHERTP